MGIKLVIELTRKAYDLLLSGVGPVDAKISTESIHEDRLGEVRKRLRRRVAEGRGREDCRRVSVAVQRVIRCWRDHPYIRCLESNRGQETRNYQLSKEDVRKSIPLAEKAICALGEEELLQSLNVYLAVCEAGGHVRANGNYGFRTLVGFLMSVLRAHKSGRVPWWKETLQDITPLYDPAPDITELLIRTYGGVFLGNYSYVVKNPSREFRLFLVASDKLRSFMEQYGLQLSDRDSVIRCLVKCVRQVAEDSFVYPGHFASKSLWAHAMPQAAREMGLINE